MSQPQKSKLKFKGNEFHMSASSSQQLQTPSTTNDAKPKSKLKYNKNKTFDINSSGFTPAGNTSTPKLSNSINKLNPSKSFQPTPQYGMNNMNSFTPMQNMNPMGNIGMMGMNNGMMGMNNGMMGMNNGMMGMPMMGMNNYGMNNGMMGMNNSMMGMNNMNMNNNMSSMPNMNMQNNIGTNSNSLNNLLGNTAASNKFTPAPKTANIPSLTSLGGNTPLASSSKNTNFSNEETKRLAKKLKEAKEKKEQSNVPATVPEETNQKTTAQINADREKRTLEAETKKAQESLKTEEVSDLQKEFGNDEDEEEEQDNAADEASEDSESYHSENDDFDHLPQERPERIRYSKKMILEFIKRESKKPFEDDYIFETLIREITKVSRKDSHFERGGGRYNNKYERHDRNGGGRYNNKYDRNDRRGGRNDRYGGRNNRNDRYDRNNNAPTLTRNKMTDEQAAKLRDLRNDKDDWSSRNQGIADDLVTMKREINLKLFQVTPENFEDVMRDCHKYCDNLEKCEIFVNILVDKAWVQYKYTKLYAKMCIKLGNITWSWATGKTKEDKANQSKKKFKSFVVTKIRKEFLHGFRKFKEKMISWHKDDEIDEDYLFEKYLKDKNKLTGNITFISELYLLSYLPHKVMRFITYKLITQFCDEVRQADEEELKLKYPIYDEYLDALFNLFIFSGSKIISRERRSSQKQQQDGKILCPTPQIDKLVEYLAESCKNKNFNYDKAKLVIPDTDRKEADCLELSFRFINQLVAKKALSARMEALVVNLNDKRDDGFKLGKDAQKGPMKLKDFHDEMEKEKDRNRRGGRDHYGGDRRRNDRYDNSSGGGYQKKSSRNFDRKGGDRYNSNKGSRYGGFDRYDDDSNSEYTKKSNTSNRKSNKNTTSMNEIVEKKEEPKKDITQIATEEIKSFFKSNSKDATFDPYPEFFAKTNENLSDLSYEQITKLWLKLYHDCWANTANQRAKIPSLLFTQWKGTEEKFLEIMTEGFHKMTSEDIPHKKKSLATLIVDMYKTHKIDFGKIKWVFDGDNMKKEDQMWFYRELMEEVDKISEEAGVKDELTPITAALTTLAKAM